MKSKLILSLLIFVLPNFSQAGKEIYMAKCASCHDANIPTTPLLQGQRASYLTSSLNMFKDGNRQNFIMEYLADQLSYDEIKSISSYLGSQDACSVATDVEPMGGDVNRGFKKSQS